MNINIYLYIMTAGLVSTLIRVLPSTLIRKKIENRFLQSFLYYLPYITIVVMTFPAIINSTDHLISGILALIAGVCIAWFTSNLFVVAGSCCVVVFVTEMIITYLL